MKKKISLLVFMILLTLLAACGGESPDDYPVPEELVISKEPGREEFKDQFNLAMGETGYVVDVPNKTPLSVTLNEVKLLEEFQGEKSSLGPYFMLANVTVSNFGENFIAEHQMEYPVLATLDQASILSDGDRPGRRELAGYGQAMYRYDTKIDNESFKQGGEYTGDILLSVEQDLDSYLLWFGFQGYSNNITFEIAKSEMKIEQ